MKLKLFLLFIILISSCAIPNTWIIPEEINHMHDAENFMHHFDYIENKNEWSKLEKTYDTMTGDCVELSAMLNHIMVYKLGYTGVKMAYCYSPETGYHFIVYHDGVYYEGQTAQPIKTEYYIIKYINYETYLYWSNIGIVPIL